MIPPTITAPTDRRPPRSLAGDPAKRIAAVEAEPPAGPRWWLWPHLGSLDAPLVAVVWQRWWAHAAHVRLRWQEEVILALAVWMIYLADRLADVACQPDAAHETTRHRFYGQARATVGGFLAGSLLTLGVIAPRWLSPREFRAGLGLLALAGGYFWTVHRQRRWSWTTILPKEAAVGGLFALGTALFVLCRVDGPTGNLPVEILGFAALCFLNCALIARWECTVRDCCDPTSLLNAFPSLTSLLPTGCLALAGAALVLAIVDRDPVFLPVGASALVLGWLDRRRASLSADALRVLADVALLTPACLLPFIR